MIKIAVIACHETDDIELIVPVTIWRKAGMRVDIISLDKKNSVILQSGTKFGCNGIIEKTNFSQYNAIYLPGGVGAKRYFSSDWTPKNIDVVLRLHKALDQFVKTDKKYIIAIDQAPKILLELGLLPSSAKIACNPELKSVLKSNYCPDNVVISKSFITAKDVTAAFDLTFSVINELVDKKTASTIKNSYYPEK